jgi:hypothetical protein
MAMGAMAASTAIGIGLTFVTFGISDAVAEGAAAAAVGTMEAVCTALDISLEAAVQVMIAAIRIGVQLAVKFTWQFGINVVSQETANAVQGQGLDHVNLLQAAEFAAAATLIPGVAGKVTIGGKQVLQGASGAFVSGALTDTAVQGMEGVTEGKPFSVGEVVASGVLATGGHALAGSIGSRMGGSAAGVEPQAARNALVSELRASGVKFTESEIVDIGRTGSGRVVWLEQGTPSAGLRHIMSGHAADFARVGVTTESDVSTLVMDTLRTKTPVQVEANGGQIFRVMMGGTERDLRIVVGSNGFVVTAYPVTF